MNRSTALPAWKPVAVSTGDPSLPPGPPPGGPTPGGPAQPGGWDPGIPAAMVHGMAPPAPAPGRRPPLSSGAVIALTVLATFGALATVGFAFMGLFLAFGADSCSGKLDQGCGDTIGVAILGNIVAQGVLFLVAVVTPWIRPIRPGWRIAIVAAVIPLSLAALILAFVVAASSVPSTT
ncbi:MAG: hypothetical protein U0Q07_18755 [Acidimicrobiales bacterium]